METINKTQQILTIVPQQYLEDIRLMLTEVLKNQGNELNDNLGEFIDQNAATKIVGRKGTWFFEMRRSGRLPYYKVGHKKIMYAKSDIIQLIESNKKGG